MHRQGGERRERSLQKLWCEAWMVVIKTDTAVGRVWHWFQWQCKRFIIIDTLCAVDIPQTSGDRHKKKSRYVWHNLKKKKKVSACFLQSPWGTFWGSWTVTTVCWILSDHPLFWKDYSNLHYIVHGGNSFFQVCPSLFFLLAYLNSPAKAT